MAKVSEQIREVALRVCDQLARYEDAIAAAEAASSGARPGHETGSRQESPTGIAEYSGAGSSFRGHSSKLGLAANASGEATGLPGGQDSLVAAPLSIVLDQAANADLEALLRDAARVKSEFDEVIAAGAGVVAKRSTRELGYAGWAQSTGDRTAVNLVQRLTGSTKTEAFRQVRLGEAMGEADAAAHPVAFPPDPSGSDLLDPNRLLDEGLDPDRLGGASEHAGGEPVRPAPVVPWHQPLTRAAREGVIRSEAVTIIMRGLGAPNERVGAGTLRAAAEEIVADAAGVHADELGFRARQIRDRIDPAGVQLRWDERHANRKWRFGRTEDGTKTAYVTFEDEGAAWMESIVGAAMRARRGGPRMVDPIEAERAEKLRLDPRTNDQIVYDTLMGALRTGVQADPSTTFGSRQPGVRLVITQEQLDTRTADDVDVDGPVGTGYFEDGKDAVPTGMVEKQICVSGIRPVLMDTSGSPLDVGREQRLFTTKQRIAMSIRDGGCRIEECEAPPSQCEAHHIDEWVAHDGLTDLAAGVLLCPFHHHLVHNSGHRVVRMEGEYYVVPPPRVDGERKPIRMPSKSPLEKERLRRKAVEVAEAAERAAARARSESTNEVLRNLEPWVPGESSVYPPPQRERRVLIE
ncbi:HNH endonuclease [Mycetocola manganoxydans]|uniref:HNH endonuclease n=1 Tax=Mycetocola manganoxydans TaxID=699879 RepID=A0A3L6ZVC4_9MICO|nr:DUF222 domain-containing protein [Mycetocola manganoxydans]RLP71943.1 HNH endonuclease [Mycetocola manganoxydans]GHD47220.1 hypothetical protein GCM10008097_17880 [Mycetocola manganoxydans]